MLARAESFALEEESLHQHLRHFADPEAALPLSAGPGRWVPSLVKLTKRVQRAPNAKATILPPSQRRLLPSGPLSFLQQPAGFQLTRQPRRAQSAGKRRAETGRVAPPGCGHARLGKAAVPSSFLASCQMASVSQHPLGFDSLPFTLGGKRLFLTPPPPILKKKKKKSQLCLSAKRSLLPRRSDSQAFAFWTLHAVVQIGTRFKTPDVQNICTYLQVTALTDFCKYGF